MGEAILILALLVFASFAFVIFFGAPYLPTLNPQVRVALDLLEVEQGKRYLELGSGDGKVLAAIAKRGASVVGYELNPVLVFISWIRCLRYGKKARVVWGNFWTVQLPQADGIFVFLYPKYMQKLDKKIIQYDCKPVKLVSFAFEIPNKEAAATKEGVYLYKYT